jgi:hypothetical protein
VQTVQPPEPDLISRALLTYWSDGNATFTMSSEVRMASVFNLLATEIETWAPPEPAAELPRRTVQEVVARLRWAASLHAAPANPPEPTHGRSA